MERPALHQTKDAFSARRFGAFHRRSDRSAVHLTPEVGLSRSMDRPALHDARNDWERHVRPGIAPINGARTSRATCTTEAVPSSTFIDGGDEARREVR
jgi:hypothetical protein